MCLKAGFICKCVQLKVDRSEIAEAAKKMYSHGFDLGEFVQKHFLVQGTKVSQRMMRIFMPKVGFAFYC